MCVLAGDFPSPAKKKSDDDADFAGKPAFENSKKDYV